MVAELLNGENLNVFKRIRTCPPICRELGFFLPLVIIVSQTRLPSACSGTMMIGRILDIVWKQSSYSARRGCLFVVKKEKKVEDHYFDNQILLEGFSSIRTMAQKTFFLRNKISLVNIPKSATCFLSAIQTLHTDELDM